jgi:hypothetical protein
LKKLSPIRIFIEGDLNESISGVQKIIDSTATYYDNVTNETEALNWKPSRDYDTLSFYSIKHARFDILEHFEFTTFDNNQIWKLGKHLGGKYERFENWIKKFNESEYRKMVGSDFEMNVINSAIDRSANLYNEEFITYMIDNYTFAFDKYRNIMKDRTTTKGLGFFKKLNRTHKLKQLLDE